MRLRQESKACDLTAIMQTWLLLDINDMEIALPGMFIDRHDRPSKGGVLALYFRKDLQCEPIEDLVSTVQDYLWSRLRLKGDDNCSVAVI